MASRVFTGKRGVGSLTLLFLWCTVALAAPGDDHHFRRVDVMVSFVDGTFVYLNAGSDAGLMSGDRVDLQPRTGPTVQAIIRVVSRQSARAELVPGASSVTEPGIAGFVMIPQDRTTTASGPSAPGSTAVPHPPWKGSIGDHGPNAPLLAGSRPTTDSGVPDSRLRGRVFSQFDLLRATRRGRRYSLARSGLDFTWENPLQQYGNFIFDGEVYDRRTGTSEPSAEVEQRMRVDRLSYHSNHQDPLATRFEAGRFLQNEFPEFGVVDGAEVTARPGEQHRVGASAGLFPDYAPDFETGNDSQASVYYRFLFDPQDLSSIGAGYQKTLHKGDGDRDLVVLKGRHFQPRGLSLFGTAWVDFYNSADTAKSSGPELTQMFLNATHPLGSSGGVGASVNHFRFVQTKHVELPPVLQDSLSNLEVTRAGLNGWQNINSSLQLQARLDRWMDQRDAGGSGEVGCTARNVLFDDGDVRATLHASKGSVTQIQGARLGLRQATGAGTLQIHYDVTHVEPAGTSSGTSAWQHVLRASLDMDLGARCYFSTYAEQRLGGGQDAAAVGFHFSIRF